MVSRPRIVGPPSGPEPPFPHRMEGTVISGFGRGSKQLGIPTANLPVDNALTPWIAEIPSGVYFGYASLLLPADHPDHSPTFTPNPTPTPTPQAADHNPFQVFPMVMSIGFNPFYKNTLRSAEVHILHSFSHDFYNAPMRLLICGFIREEKDYDSLDALVTDIRFDCDVTRESLAREGWAWDTVGKGGDAAWLVAPWTASS